MIATFFSFSAHAQCTASFGVNYAPNSLTVQFVDSSTYPTNLNIRYSWWYGDGTSSSSIQNPTYTFSRAGTFLVYLSVFDSLNTCFDSTSRYVTVPGPSPPCTSSFSYQIQPNGANSVVSFSNQSSFYSDSAVFTYDFGNGQSYTTVSSLGNLNPQQTYAPGSYLASLSIVDSLSGSSCFFADSIIVPGNTIPCSIDFNYSITPQQNTSLVDFNNQSQNFDSTGYFTYLFGDGNSIQVNANNNSIDTQWVYSPGEYLFRLGFFDPVSRDSCTKADSIKIPFNQYCNAGFRVSFQGDTARFINEAIGFSSLIYYFGDGDSSTAENPIHEYTQSNTYTVTQIVFDSLSNCSDTISKDIAVTISGSCVAKFSPAIDTTKKQLLYLINQSSDVSTHRFFWDFGDGDTAVGKTPIHDYDNYGTYPICLTVSDPALNCISQYCDTIGLDSNSLFIRKSNGFTLKVLDGGSIGITENEALSESKVFPNPFQDQVTIELKSPLDLVHYQLVSMEGKVISQGRFNQSINHLNTVDLLGGFYLLYLKHNDHIRMVKLIKTQ